MNQIDLKKLTAPPNPWHMLRSMGGVGIVCALLIVVTFQATLGPINHNKAEALEKAVFKALPGTKSRATFKINPDGSCEPFQGETRGEKLVYAGYDENKRLVGIAVEAQGQGFQDVIRLIYGYSPEKQAIIGYQVLESKDTPGLGDKVEKDAEYLKNFEALDVALSDDGSALKHLVEFVKKGNKQQPWQIEGITGATISSRAVANIVQKSTAETLPVLAKNVDKFKDIGQ